MYVSIDLYMFLMEGIRKGRDWKDGYKYIEGRMKLRITGEMQASKLRIQTRSPTTKVR